MAAVIERFVPCAFRDVAERRKERRAVRRAPVLLRILIVGELGAADAGDVLRRAQDIRADRLARLWRLIEARAAGDAGIARGDEYRDAFGRGLPEKY